LINKRHELTMNAPLQKSRRSFLIACAGLLVAGTSARARTIAGALPWEPGTASPPPRARPGPWQFFTADEAGMVEAIVDRLIPEDDRSVGGKGAGCAVYIDRQLAGPFGSSADLYTRPPFMPGVPGQGYQGPDAPAARFRTGLAALERYSRRVSAGKRFHELSGAEQDRLLTAMEDGTAAFDATRPDTFFSLVLQMTQEGFFADPIYGGNRGMAGWKLIGFPGARYDFRDWVDRHNEPYPMPPIGIMGSTKWTSRD
jgi:gluconate 2-dehydrogenase gamma chain